MNADIIIIGGGASGLMAAYGAASAGNGAKVLVIEKMPRPGRKIMVSGKGRCNLTNVKEWEDFSAHLRTPAAFLRPAFYNFSSHDTIGFMEDHGQHIVVERGDRAFPDTYKASSVVDALVRAAERKGVKIQTRAETSTVELLPEDGKYRFRIRTKAGAECLCKRLVIATGGLSYPGTGSTGDGYRWAQELGIETVTQFPSLTAMVPEGYKSNTPTTGQKAARVLAGMATAAEMQDFTPDMKGHIHRSTPLSEWGRSLCGQSLKNVGAGLWTDGKEIQHGFGDLDFTDGGIEGPIGFELSRNCVKTIVNGGKVEISIDLKPAMTADEVADRVHTLWKEIQKDPRSARLGTKEMFRIMLGKLMPWDLITGFTKSCDGIIKKKKGLTEINLDKLCKYLKDWRLRIAGFVGWERCVVTAGGISTKEIVPKTMESRKVKGLYFCGEILDVDCDTGGYNMQSAFSTGWLAGQSAAKSLL